MSPQQDAPSSPGRPPSSRGRLRRSGQALVRVGAVLLAISLVVALVGGLTTRGLINNLRDNSAELLDGTATVSLSAGAQRALYVTGGLVAPGEDLPTPVEDIDCTVSGPGGDVPVRHLSDEGQRVGLDNPLARFQVVGSFRAAEAGDHTIECNGLGVVVAPEVSPADGLLRLGALMLGSLGTFAGVTMLLIGGILLLVVRHGTDETEDDGYAVGDGAEPPSEGAEEWWEDETRSPAAVRAADGPEDDTDDDTDDVTDDVDAETDDADLELVGDELDASDDDYVELTDEELAALSDEQIAELVASGALVFVDEDGDVAQRDEPFDQDAQSDTYR
ncbi:hypothetical protein [Ornithinimicrobium pekingense]|uniref:Uncharacterized protein n=1 Tax=Ornithinimicrobium pekingense TaxID=384677 RepID=A0ABQ2F9Y4_9MICO|nr:hypothetical protein [Ornithinimicrobium pekingense]GGK68210.1 hypothetical protein GCM10011509_15740 [Ornithinimicrobium pekingense]